MASMYSAKVMEHFANPHNVGEIPDANGVGEVGNPKCGDIMRMYLKIENNVIVDVKFLTFGCGAAIATSSMATDLIKGKTIEEALKVTNKMVADSLGGLPPVKMHCSVLAEEALHAAIQDYKDRMEKGEKPCHLGNIHTANQSGERILSTPPWYAYLRIAEGCDNHCAYCVIPSLRGKYRSRPMNELLDEAAELASAGVMAVIGTYGSAVTEASQNIIDEAEIMQIATGSTSVRLTEKGLPLFFRTCPRDDAQGHAAATTIIKGGYKAVALLHDNSSYAKGLAQETKAQLDKLGVKVVFYDALTPGERDYTAILTKLKAAKPDLIFFTGYYPETGMLLRQKREMGWNVPMMGGDAANHQDLVKIAGNEAAEGYFFVSPPLPQDMDTPEAKAFLDAFKARYHAVPVSVWAVLAGHCGCAGCRPGQAGSHGRMAQAAQGHAGPFRRAGL